MSEITVRDTCPHCRKTTIVYSEIRSGVKTKDGSITYPDCQRCNKQIKNLPWEKREWHIARILKPKSIGE